MKYLVFVLDSNLDSPHPLTDKDKKRIMKKLDIFIDDVYNNCFSDRDIILMLYFRLNPTFNICFR